VAKQLRIFTRMAKVKSSPSSNLCQYVSEFRNMFTSDDKALFCQAYEKPIVTQHLSGSINIAAAVRLKDGPGRQSLIGEPYAARSSSGLYKFATFASDVHKALVSTDIPPFKK
jgi:hypothetical protein